MVERRGDPSYRVRVRLSALINFLANIYRTIASFIFTLVVIRRLDPQDYGLYATLLGIANALASPIGIWIYWGSRRHILGVGGSLRGALALGGIYAVLSTPVFIAASYPFTGGSLGYIALSILILVFYVLLAPLSMVISLVMLYAPDRGGVLGLLFETVRVALAYVLVVMLGIGVFGAVVGPGIAGLVLVISGALILARMGVISIDTRAFRLGFKGSSEAVRILKLSALSIPSIVTSALGNLDKAIMGLISSSTIPAAYASISSVPKAFITPGAFTSGLYAKILREPRAEDVIDIVIIYSFISIFLASSMITLSVPAISLFNPAYIDGAILFALASLEALVLGYASIFETVAVGSERADVRGGGLSLIASSPLGRIPLAQMVRAMVCIAAASSAQLALWATGVRDPVALVLPYSIAYMVSSVPYALYVYRLAISKISFRIPWRDILIFTLASLASSSIQVSLGLSEISIRSFWRDLGALVPGAVISAAAYASLSIPLSNRVRSLLAAGLKYLFK